jgi:hypothetical protein
MVYWLDSSWRLRAAREGRQLSQRTLADYRDAIGTDDKPGALRAYFTPEGPLDRPNDVTPDMVQDIVDRRRPGARAAARAPRQPRARLPFLLLRLAAAQEALPGPDGEPVPARQRRAAQPGDAARALRDRRGVPGRVRGGAAHGAPDDGAGLPHPAAPRKRRHPVGQQDHRAPRRQEAAALPPEQDRPVDAD